MIDFSLSSTSHSEAFSEPATGFTVIRKVAKPYGTGAHVLVPVQHAGKRCVVVVLED
jgi:putative transposon-encoded protein